MTIGDFKKWVANIPSSMENAEIWYVDFSRHDEAIQLRIDDAGARIAEGDEDIPYSDGRGK